MADRKVGKICDWSRAWARGRNSTGTESEKVVAIPAKAFSEPGPYCMAKTPGGFPFVTRA